MIPSTRDGRQPLEDYTPAASVGPARVVPNAPVESSESRASMGSAWDMWRFLSDLYEAEGLDRPEDAQ